VAKIAKPAPAKPAAAPRFCRAKKPAASNTISQRLSAQARRTDNNAKPAKQAAKPATPAAKPAPKQQRNLRNVRQSPLQQGEHS